MTFIRKNWWPIILLCIFGIFILAWFLRGWLTDVSLTDARDALSSKRIAGVEVSHATGAKSFGHDGLNLVLEGPASQKAAAIAAVSAGASADNVIYEANTVIEKPAPKPKPVPQVKEVAPPPPPAEVVEKVNTDLNKLFGLEPIQFASARSEIQSRSFSTLDEAARILNLNPTVELRVVGHTDSSGNAESNMTLSQSRAQSVVSYLVGKGVSSTRLHAEGRGETELLVNPELTAADKQLNRRINWERKR